MLLSLDDLAKKHGQIAPVVVDGGRYQWQHRVADLLHGWTLHNYHHQAHPVLLSDEAYLAALKEAESGLGAHAGALPSKTFPLVQPDPDAEVKALRARVSELEAAARLPDEPPADEELDVSDETEEDHESAESEQA